MRKVMVLDCEYMQPSKRCIQIGAAVYDLKSGQLIEILDTFVDPKEPISQYITDLTGIRDQDVKGAPNIVEAWEMLKKLHKKHKCFKNPIVWGSGIRNDSQALFEEYCDQALNSDIHNIDQPDKENFMGWRVIDAKTLYVSLQLFDDGQYAGGLADSMKRIGLNFEGDTHRALNDAKNTFSIWYYLTKKLSEGRKK